MIYHLASFPYKRDVGPGVFDVHSPNVPSVEAILNKIESFSETNILQDCGLKTRKWQEVLPALKRMVNAAKEARKRSKQN
jgi:5-methyltetrahydropteroyltriglutamate--homocysteine methyltransferase